MGIRILLVFYLDFGEPPKKRNTVKKRAMGEYVEHNLAAGTPEKTGSEKLF